MKRFYVLLIMSTLLVVFLVERFLPIAAVRTSVYVSATVILLLVGAYSFYLQLKKK